MKQPLIYVVTKNYNQYETTANFIKSLKKLTYKNFKIVITDSASTDDSADRIEKEFPNVIVIRSEVNNGYCEGLNMGIKVGLDAGADYFFTLNNDIIDFSPNYFEEVVKVFNKDNKIGMVGTVSFDRHKKYICNGKPKYKFGIRIDVPTEGYIIKRDVFEKIGLFDESLVSYVEDLDMIARLRLAGFETAIADSVSFLHIGGGAFSKQIYSPNYYRVRNHIIFMKKYCSDKSFIWKISMSIIWLDSSVRRLLHHLSKLEIKSFILSCWYIFSGYIDGLKFKVE